MSDQNEVKIEVSFGDVVNDPALTLAFVLRGRRGSAFHFESEWLRFHVFLPRTVLSNCMNNDDVAAEIAKRLPGAYKKALYELSELKV